MNTLFLLTHPLRGATKWKRGSRFIKRFLLTHPLRGATTSGQIGALHWRFLLTHPLRGATQKRNRCLRIFSISTHTPLAGCNKLDSGVGRLNINFYSHTPCGVQQLRYCCRQWSIRFLLTHPLRGATKTAGKSMSEALISTHTPLAGCNVIFVFFVVYFVISTHTPLAGCNITAIDLQHYQNDFYSHTPCGVQLKPDMPIIPPSTFLLTHPLRGATRIML